MTTESISGKSGAKERIKNAIIGLLIALLIWIILNTINPNLLKFNFNLPQRNFSDSTSQQVLTGDQGKTIEERVAGQIDRAAYEDTIKRGDGLAPPTERQKRAQNNQDILNNVTTVPVQCENFKDPLTLKLCISDIERGQ
jgi:hypothetical protein